MAGRHVLSGDVVFKPPGGRARTCGSVERSEQPFPIGPVTVPGVHVDVPGRAGVHESTAPLRGEIARLVDIEPGVGLARNHDARKAERPTHDRVPRDMPPVRVRGRHEKRTRDAVTAVQSALRDRQAAETVRDEQAKGNGFPAPPGRPLGSTRRDRDRPSLAAKPADNVDSPPHNVCHCPGPLFPRQGTMSTA